jgi:hypothetical protein
MISVIIPSLNQGKFLEDALRSALNQSFRDLEVIVIDGGSNDGSLDVLKRISDVDQRFRWTSGRDAGPADALNKGLATAKGEIVAWLNADDLYAPGALDCVMAEFTHHPELVMVYGQGQNINESGHLLGEYPTLPPSTPLDRFQEGCFISQPTVFMRRSALEELGFLDEKLKTAFDFDLWIRFFQKYPGRIGFIDKVLAQTRIHGDTITHNQREVVALEAVTILHRHLGPAPAHWILHHFEEILESYPGSGALSPRERCESLLERARPYLSPVAISEIEDRLTKDRRLQLALPDVFVRVFPDGWAGSSLKVRVRRPEDGSLSLVLSASSEEDPCAPRMKVTVFSDDGMLLTKSVRSKGQFKISLPLKGIPKGKVAEFLIKCDQSFSPSEFPESREDQRKLSYQVTSCEFRRRRFGSWW